MQPRSQGLRALLPEPVAATGRFPQLRSPYPCQRALSTPTATVSQRGIPVRLANCSLGGVSARCVQLR